jgi:hypothetical protein
MHAAALASPVTPPKDDLRALLDNLAAESGELSEAADGLQVLFGQLMADPPERPRDALEQAQALDRLVQRLQGLEVFLRGLCASDLYDLSADAADVASTLRLTSQARRFSPAGAEAATEAAAGDCDLF